MKLYPVKTGLIKVGEDLVNVCLDALRKQRISLKDGDVLAFTSKIVSYSERRLVKLNELRITGKARRAAKKYALAPQFAQLIIDEADEIYGGVEKTVLTLKAGVLTANAGIDNKNAPKGYAVLWPSDPKKSAASLRSEIRLRTGKNVATIILDSGLEALRIGTSGLALAVAGFKPIRDTRGHKDLYGKPLLITRHAVADDLASAAHVLMGEAAEKTPIALIRDAPIDVDEGAYEGHDMMMPFDKCIFMGTFLKCWRESKNARVQ